MNRSSQVTGLGLLGHPIGSNLAIDGDEIVELVEEGTGNELLELAEGADENPEFTDGSQVVVVAEDNSRGEVDSEAFDVLEEVGEEGVLETALEPEDRYFLTPDAFTFWKGRNDKRMGPDGYISSLDLGRAFNYMVGGPGEVLTAMEILFLKVNGGEDPGPILEALMSSVETKLSKEWDLTQIELAADEVFNRGGNLEEIFGSQPEPVTMESIELKLLRGDPITLEELKALVSPDGDEMVTCYSDEIEFLPFRSLMVRPKGNEGVVTRDSRRPLARPNGRSIFDIVAKHADSNLIEQGNYLVVPNWVLGNGDRGLTKIAVSGNLIYCQRKGMLKGFEGEQWCYDRWNSPCNRSSLNAARRTIQDTLKSRFGQDEKLPFCYSSATADHYLSFKSRQHGGQKKSNDDARRENLQKKFGGGGGDNTSDRAPRKEHRLSDSFGSGKKGGRR